MLDDAAANATANPETKLFQDRLKAAAEKHDKAKTAFADADKAWVDAKAALADLQKPVETKTE